MPGPSRSALRSTDPRATLCGSKRAAQTRPLEGDQEKRVPEEEAGRRNKHRQRTRANLHLRMNIMTEWPEGDNGRSGRGAPGPAGEEGAGGEGEKSITGKRGKGEGGRRASAANQEMPAECQPIYSRFRGVPWGDLARGGVKMRGPMGKGGEGVGRGERSEEDWEQARRGKSKEGERGGGRGSSCGHRTPQGNFKPEGRCTHDNPGRQPPLMHAGRQAGRHVHKLPDNDLTTRQAECASKKASKRRVQATAQNKQADKQAGREDRKASRQTSSSDRKADCASLPRRAHEWSTSAQAERAGGPLASGPPRGRRGGGGGEPTTKEQITQVSNDHYH